jgi:hypothetical protein
VAGLVFIGKSCHNQNLFVVRLKPAMPEQKPAGAESASAIAFP